MSNAPSEVAPKPPRRQVELDLELGSDPISGHITAADGRRSFSGWVELTGAISDAHQTRSSDPSDRPPRTGEGR